MSSLLLICAGAALILFACSGDGDNDSAIEFPLRVGYHWEYCDSLIDIVLPQDTIVQYDTSVANYSCDIVGIDTLFDYDSTVVFHFFSEMAESTQIFYDHEYRQADSSGLYLFGYYYGFMGPPLGHKSSGRYCEFRGIRANSTRQLMQLLIHRLHLQKLPVQDSIYYEDPPILELAYPLYVGLEWVYRDTSLAHPWNISKQVVSRDLLNLPATGPVSCFEILYLSDTDHDGQWDDDLEFHEYVSAIGILKWDITISGIEYYDELGNPIGSYDSREIFTLVHHSP